MYKQEAVIIRRFKELEVIILDKRTIWVIPTRASTRIIFHRWFSPPLGSWENWRRFRQKLYANKSVSLNDVYKWARMHGIESMGTTRDPTLKGRKVVEKR